MTAKNIELGKKLVNRIPIKEIRLAILKWFNENRNKTGMTEKRINTRLRTLIMCAEETCKLEWVPLEFKIAIFDEVPRRIDYGEKLSQIRKRYAGRIAKLSNIFNNTKNNPGRRDMGLKLMKEEGLNAASFATRNYFSSTLNPQNGNPHKTRPR